MLRIFLCFAILTAVFCTLSHGQDWIGYFDDEPARQRDVTSSWHNSTPFGAPYQHGSDDFDGDLSVFGSLELELEEHVWLGGLNEFIVRGQDAGGSSGGGAAAATNPSVPLTQMQFQNQFIPNTYGASGYSNVFIIQPVLPIQLNSEFFPFHILRPTLPVIAPSADPDGPAGVQGGLGDLNFFDLFIHPIEEWQTNIAVGYSASIPTATHPQLGSREWQLGPAAAIVTTAIPKWNLGGIVEIPYSLQSADYKVRVQPIVVRMLEDQWYVGWGDLLWTVDDQNGTYNLPINLRIGKVLQIHGRPMNIFLQGQYTPEGFHNGPTAEWGIKLNVTVLFPQAKLGPFFGGIRGDCSCE